MNMKTELPAGAPAAHAGASRNLELDRLRAIAVLLTFYVHLYQVFYPWTFTMHYPKPESVLDLFGNAWAGVDLFFVISGYIISRTLLEQLDGLRSGVQRAACIKAFYVRRVFRILPVAWVVVALVMACSLFLNQGQYFASPVYNAQAALGIFTYTFNFWLPDNKIAEGVPLAPYWSLSVEEQFYLFYPLFLLVLKSTRARVMALVGGLLLVSLVLRPFSLSDPMKVFFFTQTRCDGLLYGCLLYLATTQSWFEAIRVRAGQYRYAGAWVVVLLALVLGSVTAIGFGNTLAIPVVCALSLVLVFMAACEGNLIVFPQPLQWALDYLGKRSYTLYLVHIPMFYLTLELMFRYTRSEGIAITDALWPQYTVLMLALVFGATELIHRTVEKPMIAFGKRIAERARVPAEAAPQALAPTPAP
ncbi:acyltransferase family protein [Pseudomonas tohonis]|uniref:acyltransferase family protein n=1 Tax=Pseudomonas tohonis TaxID=2725477 RepID=UPI0021DB61D7|nr:acyltransferase [Pseudomonas tohonis]UXY53992.1 acyltransferase [Pseudomonas tohonis]